MCSVGEIVKRMKEEDYDMEEKHEKATLSHVQQNLEALSIPTSCMFNKILKQILYTKKTEST